VNAAAESLGSSLPEYVLASIAIVIFRYTRDPRLLFASFHNGRIFGSMSTTFGMFGTTHYLNIDTSPRAHEIVRNIARTMREAAASPLHAQQSIVEMEFRKLDKSKQPRALTKQLFFNFLGEQSDEVPDEDGSLTHASDQGWESDLVFLRVQHWLRFGGHTNGNCLHLDLEYVTVLCGAPGAARMLADVIAVTGKCQCAQRITDLLPERQWKEASE